MVEPIIGSNPDISIGANRQGIYRSVLWASRQIHVNKVSLLKAVQSYARAKPEIALAVLANCSNCVVSKTVFNRVGMEFTVSILYGTTADSANPQIAFTVFK